MKFTDDFGNTVNEEQLDAMALAIENEDFSDFMSEGNVVYGMVEPNKSERSTVCVQFPSPMKTRLNEIA